MRFAIILTIAFVVGISCEEKYTSKYDNVDLDNIIKNDRLLKNYVDCLLDKGKCTKDGAELKKHIVDALDSDCSKCSDKQRGGIRKMIKHLAQNKREMWNALVAKYDPEGVYRQKYANVAQEEGIVF